MHLKQLVLITTLEALNVGEGMEDLKFGSKIFNAIFIIILLYKMEW